MLLVQYVNLLKINSRFLIIVIQLCRVEWSDSDMKQLFVTKKPQPAKKKKQLKGHTGINCCGCPMSPILGARYKCTLCNVCLISCLLLYDPLTEIRTIIYVKFALRISNFIYIIHLYSEPNHLYRVEEQEKYGFQQKEFQQIWRLVEPISDLRTCK
jgi:hypothetical protein